MIDWPPAAFERATLAIGWATVELERAAGSLGARLRGGTRFEAAPRSVTLGARCLVGLADGPAGRPIRLVLLEPDREGRLAGFLARTGEAWVATWIPSPTGPASTGPAAGGWRPGPLGPERSLAPDAAGRFRFVVGPATIEP